jgi:hypothetical protein
MVTTALAATRRSLHGIAELVIAGPQHRADGTIRLRVTPGGFGGAVADLRVEGAELVFPAGRAPLGGTCRELATAAGVEVGAPVGVYGDTSGVEPDEPLTLDPEAVSLVELWFGLGDAALRAFAPEIEPVLWPEHFDLGIALDEVNYGVSPGDGVEPEPYAYVGPWNQRKGEFWNTSFGAVRTADDIADAATLTAFFAEGRRQAAG